MFSGSLYLVAIWDIKWLGAVTPVGGSALIIGWLCLVVAAGGQASAGHGSKSGS
jgi:uncharacterized membrane protein YgdD (TMEM256/DUF423 family)